MFKNNSKRQVQQPRRTTIMLDSFSVANHFKSGHCRVLLNRTKAELGASTSQWVNDPADVVANEAKASRTAVLFDRAAKGSLGVGGETVGLVQDDQFERWAGKAAKAKQNKKGSKTMEAGMLLFLSYGTVSLTVTLAKFLTFSRMTLIPRSSLAFNSKILCRNRVGLAIVVIKIIIVKDAAVATKANCCLPK